jgi:hypothetical protein
MGMAHVVELEAQRANAFVDPGAGPAPAAAGTTIDDAGEIGIGGDFEISRPNRAGQPARQVEAFKRQDAARVGSNQASRSSSADCAIGKMPTA